VGEMHAYFMERKKTWISVKEGRRRLSRQRGKENFNSPQGRRRGYAVSGGKRMGDRVLLLIAGMEERGRIT